MEKTPDASDSEPAPSPASLPPAASPVADSVASPLALVLGLARPAPRAARAASAPTPWPRSAPSGRLVYGSDKEGGGPYVYPDPDRPAR